MGNLDDEVRRLARLGVSTLHWDIMDAHFVPNMPCGLALLEQLRGRTGLPFDVHLMVDDNEFFIGQLAKIGVQMISVHPETANHCHRTLSMIHEIGSKAGIALSPSTPLNVLEYLTDVLDFVVIMTVNPGFSGQRLVGSAFRKIADCRTWITSRNLHVALHVDGNVSFENIPEMIAAGADTLVVGTSSLFAPRTTRDRNMTKIKTAMQKGLRLRAAIRVTNSVEKNV